MIILDDVSHVAQISGKSQKVLKGVNFRCGDTERIGILTQSDAIRSSLARLFSGVEKPTSGSIVSDTRVSWPFGQASVLHPDLSVFDNIHVLAALAATAPEESVAYCIVFGQLEQIIHHKVKDITPTQRAILGYAVSMMIPCQHYIFDEKLFVGDATFRARCEAVLTERLRFSGMVLFSRNTNLLTKHCTTIYTVDNGRIATFEDVAMDQQEVIDA